LTSAPLSFATHPSRTDPPPLSLHDALPIYTTPHREPAREPSPSAMASASRPSATKNTAMPSMSRPLEPSPWMNHANRAHIIQIRSEEHTSELQSRFDLVCRLLLEKKKKKTT